MASFVEKIKALIKVTISTDTVPTLVETSSFLVEGVIDVVNRVTAIRPDELSKFTKTTNSTSTIEKKGILLSVLREHDDTDILRVCTPISPSIRYEATDVNSLHYRSKYNPGYYELDGNVHCVPQAASGNNDIVVTQVHYDVGLGHGDDYAADGIDNFPTEYEHLVGLYAAAMSCMAIAANIHQTLSTEAVKPSIPDEMVLPSFGDEGTELPTSLPQYIAPVLDFNLSGVNAKLNNEDIEMSEKEMDKIEKKMDKFRAEQENNQKTFTKDLEIFKAELDMLIKNSDRSIQVEVGEYRSWIDKYQYDTAAYSAMLQEEMAQYKWYTEQYMTLMNQYNSGIMLIAPPKKEAAQEERRRR